MGDFSAPDGTRYIGDFLNGIANGFGYMQTPNKDEVIGEFSNNNINGLALHVKPNGERYSGEFRDNKYHGRGLYKNKSGELISGKWKRDEFKEPINNIDESLAKLIDTEPSKKISELFSRLITPQSESESESESKKQTRLIDETKYENNKLTISLYETRKVGSKCQLHFKIINKTRFNLSKNSLIGQIKGGNMGNIAFPADGFELSLGSIIDFQSLPSGLSANGSVMLNWDNECTAESLSKYSVVKLGFYNPDAIVEDGISSLDFIRVDSIVNGLTWRLSGSLDEASRLRDPKYRFRKGKIKACYDSCTAALVQCTNKYTSSRVANEICGRPNVSCLRSCDAIK